MFVLRMKANVGFALKVIVLNFPFGVVMVVLQYFTEGKFNEILRYQSYHDKKIDFYFVFVRCTRMRKKKKVSRIPQSWLDHYENW